MNPDCCLPLIDRLRKVRNRDKKTVDCSGDFRLGMREDPVIKIFYITKQGGSLANRLRGLFPQVEIERFSAQGVERAWNSCRSLIFVMASGIVVRTIAPLIKDKRTDPAIVVLDEKGRFAVSLLSGHLGGANEITKRIADFLGAEAVITTSSDVNNLLSIDLWAMDNNLAIENWKVLPHIQTKLIDEGKLNIYLDNINMKLPDCFIQVPDPSSADIIITNKQSIKKAPPVLYLHPKNLVAGIGYNSGTSTEEIEEVVKSVLAENNLSFLSIDSIATIDIKGNEKGLSVFAERYNLKVRIFSADELNRVNGVQRSEAVFNATGAYAVAEPAALLGAEKGVLLVPKIKRGNVTVAVAKKTVGAKSCSPLLYIIGTGPGEIEHITPRAQDALRNSDVIVGYGRYIDLIKDLIKDKEIISTGMTKEIERCKKAIEIACEGKIVSLISGGDPGIYGMAGLVLEILRAEEQKSRSSEASELLIEVIPGISALNACAARLGAPLMHDFVCISLSDRLTDWELIERRLEYAALGDFVTVIYNPRSMGRLEHIKFARDILLKYRSPDIPVGIVKSAMREGERVIITTLKDIPVDEIDMQTTLIIGNSKTFVWNNHMITPRGYKLDDLRSEI